MTTKKNSSNTQPFLDLSKEAGKTNPPTQSDEAWKRALERWFQPFLECFWPKIARQIDWQREVEELSQEMCSFAPSSLVGKQLVDKLYKVHTKKKQDYIILTHIEVQGDGEEGFSRRLFEYCYKIYDRYQLPILPLVVLSDDNKRWRPEAFEMNVLGHVTMRYDFLSVKLLDRKGEEAQLLESRNPFDNLSAIYLKARQTKRNSTARLKAKIAIFNHLVDQDWEQDDIVSFYTFLDGVMRLPKPLELQYHDHVIEIERKKNMSYITSAEQIGIEKGMLQGMQAGIQQGMQAGIQQGMQAIATRLLDLGVDPVLIKSATDIALTDID